jgi:hypothetical protein
LSIPALDDQIKKYIGAFDITSICIDRDGGIRVSNDPRNAEIAYWLPARSAGAVLKAARKSGDIVRAAQACRVRLTDHHVMVTRARSAIARLDQRLAEAKAAGAVSYFNAEFRRRRLAAADAAFPPYRVAEQRLRQALAEHAAGKAPSDPAALLKRVFEA